MTLGESRCLWMNLDDERIMLDVLWRSLDESGCALIMYVSWMSWSSMVHDDPALSKMVQVQSCPGWSNVIQDDPALSKIIMCGLRKSRVV